MPGRTAVDEKLRREFVDQLDLSRLPEDIRNEVCGEFKHMPHYNLHTFMQGCKGPLCARAKADNGRLHAKRRAESRGRIYIPRDSKYDDPALEKALQWYIRVFEGPHALHSYKQSRVR